MVKWKVQNFGSFSIWFIDCWIYLFDMIVELVNWLASWPENRLIDQLPQTIYTILHSFYYQMIDLTLDLLIGYLGTSRFTKKLLMRSFFFLIWRSPDWKTRTRKGLEPPIHYWSPLSSPPFVIWFDLVH